MIEPWQRLIDHNLGISTRLRDRHANWPKLLMFLRHEQTVLVEQLQHRSQSLAAIYMGGLRVLTDDENPIRYQLAAHAFRELLSNCSELTGTSPEYGEGMKQRLKPVRDAFAAMKRANETLPEAAEDATGISVSLMSALDDYFLWEMSNRPAARKKIALLLAQLAGAGPALPSDVIADDISGWMHSDEYFKAVLHHGKTPEHDEFIGKLYIVENVLLRRMHPRPVSDLDEIDVLIEEGDRGDNGN
jgi:hypothetical protein